MKQMNKSFVKAIPFIMILNLRKWMEYVEYLLYL